MDHVIARKMHRTLEPYHGIIYFAPEAAATYADIGLTGRSGYFASRSAAMGPVDAEVVIATFFNFNPTLVRRALDGVWSQIEPAVVIAARYAAVDAAMRRLLGDAIDSPEMAEAAELARIAATDLEPAGQPLFAAHSTVAWPTEPHLVLWHAQTLIREFRGDGHIACLVQAGIASGCEALVQHAASGEITADALRSSRAWPEPEWDAAVAALVERGWVDAAGHASTEGAAVRAAIEIRTDELAMAPWRQLGQEGSDRLRELVRPFSRAIVGGADYGLDAAAREGSSR
ncbi:MAG: hypothetical protein JJE52_15800 [Acidimicrobiia bacterium]|nr:hypothetical protein [Acidimicrobiia bacterium]